MLFPPLIRLFKIELCSESSFGIEILAEENVDIDHISDYRSSSYFLPTLGPSFIDLYTEPQNFKKNSDLFNKETQKGMNDENNENKRHGSYKARLQLSINSINTSIQKSSSIQNNKNDVKSKKCDEKVVKKFTAFILISDVNMIVDTAFRSDIHFQLCVGMMNIRKITISLNFLSWQ